MSVLGFDLVDVDDADDADDDDGSICGRVDGWMASGLSGRDRSLWLSGGRSVA